MAHDRAARGSPWTVETARKEALLVLAAVKKGEDPAGAKAAAKAAPTVKSLAERFLAEHAEAKRKLSTAREYRRLIANVIVPALGGRKVADVTRADIQRLHQNRRATPTEANRALALLSTVFTFAERLGERADGSNPCRHVERFPQKRRERFLSADEMGRLGDALSAYHGSPYAVAAVKLLIFTGARLGEVLGLHWEWIDFERGEARLPDSKTGAKTLHLPPPALDVLLRSVPRLEGEPHVLGGKRGTTLVEAPWRRIREAAGLDDVHLHDLRHSFASVAAAGGMGDHWQDARPHASTDNPALCAPGERSGQGRRGRRSRSDSSRDERKCIRRRQSRPHALSSIVNRVPQVGGSETAETLKSFGSRYEIW